MCLVDLEQCTVEPPEELPAFPHHSEMTDELRKLCVRYNVNVEEDGRHDSDSGKSLLWLLSIG